MKISVINHSEAINEVKEWLENAGLKWNGEKYLGNYIIEERSADCDDFPCPRGLDSWGGETSAIYIYDMEENEDKLAVAYWQDSPLPAGYTMELSISGYWRLLNSDGDLILDDPACEDVYDEESARALFLSYIAEL